MTILIDTTSCITQISYISADQLQSSYQIVQRNAEVLVQILFWVTALLFIFFIVVSFPECSFDLVCLRSLCFLSFMRDYFAISLYFSRHTFSERQLVLFTVCPLIRIHERKGMYSLLSLIPSFSFNYIATLFLCLSLCLSLFLLH